jgi:hypothetical protein
VFAEERDLKGVECVKESFDSEFTEILVVFSFEINEVILFFIIGKVGAVNGLLGVDWLLNIGSKDDFLYDKGVTGIYV